MKKIQNEPAPDPVTGRQASVISIQSSNDDADEYRKKWGLKQSSFSHIPNILLEYRDRLQIKDHEMFLLLVLLNHWWQRDRLPFPSITRLSELTGKTERSVQRNLKALVSNETPVTNGWAKESGYITIKRRFEKRRIQVDGQWVERNFQLSNEYSFDKLIYALRALEREIARNIEAAKSEARKRAPVSGNRPA